jgi:hypothetical protein
MISGLPIVAGDKAVAIPMLRHPNGDLTVTFFPIFGEYNDYGSLENIKSNEYSSRLVKLVLEAGSHSKKKKSQEKEDPSLKTTIKGIGKRFSEGKPVTDEEKKLFLDYIQARARSSDTDLDTPAFWFGDQWEYSFEKGKDIQNEADLVQIMEREHVRNNTFQLSFQGNWLPVVMNLIHKDVWDAFKVPKTTRFLRDHSALELFGKFDDSDMSRYRVEKAIFESVGICGYGFKYTPLFGMKLFGDVVSAVASEKVRYPQPLLDLYQLGLMLFNLRRDLCLPAQAGSQSANYDKVKKLAEAMLKVVSKHQSSEEDSED